MKDMDYLIEAYRVAVARSTDPSTQNGAIIVRGKKIIATGANHFPKGVKETSTRWERPAKYAWVEHAERNAIYDAAKNGTYTTKDTTMYCPWFACADCARGIIQAGITEVVGHNCPLHEGGSQSWKDSIAIANEMFKEAGVKTRYLDGTVGLKIRFNGIESEV